MTQSLDPRWLPTQGPARGRGCLCFFITGMGGHDRKSLGSLMGRNRRGWDSLLVLLCPSSPDLGWDPCSSLLLGSVPKPRSFLAVANSG